MIEHSKRYDALIDPFEERDVEWRVQQSGLTIGGKPWVIVIPYITGRAIQQRLDDVFGFDGWRNDFRETADGRGYLCGISFKDESGQWITKWDGSEYTNIEPLKGALSGAMKRTGSQLGIGRYLYNLDESFAECKTVGSRFEVEDPWKYIGVKKKGTDKNAPRTDAKWLPPELPSWAKPSFKSSEFIDQIRKASNQDDLNKVYKDAMSYAKSFLKYEFGREVQELAKARKADILNAQASTAEGKASAVKDWLNHQLINLIADAPNESVVKQLKASIRKELDEKVRAENIKPDVYLSLLERSCKRRIDLISQSNQQQTTEE